MPTKRVSFSDVVTIRHIAKVTDPEMKEALYYNPMQMRQMASSSYSSSSCADPESERRRRKQQLVAKTAQVRARTAKILERRRAKHAAATESSLPLNTSTTEEDKQQHPLPEDPDKLYERKSNTTCVVTA
eukprot:CAMPEP_0116556224 /NCGR_PEP_ID=MMETSP0397-20121206/8573_1 /TAXON_ID=216820 /ORGANISM="Cyclophora tenuis, Strain ECT3854" /LENGTH=129 /DNA_ID=CAMNT_0004081561 /DNA_START=116 /DNA_END=506 /DNA_ORIENTATION=+